MALTFELPAAIAECDIHACAEAFRWSRSTGFKARELLSQPATRELLNQLDPLPGVATTMSSMGPAIVVIADDPSALAPVRELAHPDNGWDIVTGNAANTGRRISVSP
jgi:predicted sugar kinase